ncbi:thiol-disulfide oxidoreductase DCC family protein [Dokdonia sp. 4H-3-7-5]|jgi:predicted DCC family thiol-disulfide oxidoreductase YuxK|uniref:thiol-disulfide oxidoreductase DCC family protein n=1 Tax=Dokdonia sp. (strain 4H-3-7-5) TaxID=983548 RepID=UPI00020A7C83|nr:thiol-disulfide oxidoreductase DCC family protein [Dokdonia sp. 4H-3-7-5]AEE20484.1 thiol-disulfide oxidoreductase DCC [Dokdonia sp. 4H-3-7-5]
MQNKKIILFDGVCNLCNGAITFIIQRDKNDVFRYAPLQSEVGKNLAAKHHIDLNKIDSIILVTEDKAYSKSTAALRIAKHLYGGWPLLAVFLILPRFLRNAVYDFIARNRYKWFGKKDACMIPTPELKSKFLDYEQPQ